MSLFRQSPQSTNPDAALAAGQLRLPGHIQSKETVCGCEHIAADNSLGREYQQPSHSRPEFRAAFPFVYTN
jgi:hypothetical protein